MVEFVCLVKSTLANRVFEAVLPGHSWGNWTVAHKCLVNLMPPDCLGALHLLTRAQHSYQLQWWWMLGTPKKMARRWHGKSRLPDSWKAITKEDKDIKYEIIQTKTTLKTSLSSYFRGLIPRRSPPRPVYFKICKCWSLINGIMFSYEQLPKSHILHIPFLEKFYYPPPIVLGIKPRALMCVRQVLYIWAMSVSCPTYFTSPIDYWRCLLQSRCYVNSCYVVLFKE